MGKDKVWSDRPAVHFVESSPIGNGRLGAMVFGGIAQDQILLNENSVWSGGVEDSDRADAYKVLPEIRELLLEGKNKQAEKLFMAHFTCKGKGSGFARGAKLPFGANQVLGSLFLNFFQYTSSGPGSEGVSDYRRELDLARAVVTTGFMHRGVKYLRECFVSAPAEAIVLRICADQAGKVNFNARLDRPERFETRPVREDEQIMTGQLDNGTDGNGVKFACRMRIVCKGGKVSARNTVLYVEEADEALVFITAATHTKFFTGRDSDDEIAATAEDMEKICSRTWDGLLAEHVAEYRKYYDRVKLELGPLDPQKQDLPVLSRLLAVQAGENDPGLYALYFNFGRYLFISSNRPGRLPGNLAGLWVESIQTPWNADWHLNLNQQMIYWPAEVCNLPELHEPNLRLVEYLQNPGAKTAKAYYNARGWVAHTFTNPWGFTSPGEDASWGSTTGSGAWLCHHLWDHYLFSLDIGYLGWAYPIMKGAASFYLDMLIEEPTHKWLVTAPADSPENAFYTAEGDVCQLCIGPAYDMQLLRFLFGACITASEILQVDDGFRNELEGSLKRLAPTSITADGRIMEWLEDYREALPNHRHISHLWGLFPGDEIDPARTPELAAAARKSLDMRGDASTGWAISYRQCGFAHLYDGNRAYGLLQKLLGWATFPNLFDKNYHAPETEHQPVMPPLDDYNHPFQIDGNFGGTVGIVEMLMQSRAEISVLDGVSDVVSYIHILPALPDAWPEGRVSGLRAKGGLEADIRWEGGKLAGVAIKSINGKKCVIQYRDKVLSLHLPDGQGKELDGDLNPVEG